MTLEEALTSPNLYSCTDHKGIFYKSKSEMVNTYGLKYSLFTHRLRKGWTLEETLEISPEIILLRGKWPSFSLNGEDYYTYKCPTCNNQFVFTPAECRQHYLRHKYSGEINETLYTKTPIRKLETVTDHNNNEYSSLRAMAKKYCIAVSTLKARIRRGWSLEKALTTPPDKTCIRAKRTLNAQNKIQGSSGK